RNTKHEILTPTPETRTPNPETRNPKPEMCGVHRCWNFWHVLFFADLFCVQIDSRCWAASI
ncbi:hypothetical protein T484DRAFT_1648826, partial [Baffinella frigidus]